jgi:hypothetical protein
MEYLIGFALLLIGIFIGIKLSDAFHRIMISKILLDLGITPEQLKQMETKLLDELKAEDPEAYQEIIATKSNTAAGKTLVKVKLEQHQGVLFAYREDDMTFIGQGTDQDSLIASITHRLKGVTVEITNGELLQKNNA